MKKITFILACVVFFAACGPTIENTAPKLTRLAPYPFARRYLTAVFPFTYAGRDEDLTDFTKVLPDLCVDEMFRTNRFRIVERSRIAAVIKEIGMAQYGVIDAAQADRIGKQLGAELILVGSIEAIKPISKKESVGIAWKESKGFEISLKGRLIDITRGEVIAVARAEAREVQTRKVAMGTSTGEIAPNKTLINRALQKAAAILINDLAANTPKKTAG